MSFATPSDALAALPRYALDLTNLPLVAELLGLPADRLENVFDRLGNDAYDHSRSILQEIVRRLPVEAQAYLSNPDLFAVGTTDFQFNATSIACDNGGHAVVLDKRLMSFYYVLALVLLHRAAGIGESVEPTVSLADAGETLAEVMANIRRTGQPAAQPFATEPGRTHLASDVAIEAQRFVLSHELAHIALAHVGDSRDFVTLGPRQIGPVEVWSGEQEWDADELALPLTLGPPPGPEDWEDLALRYAGCHLALDGLSLLEDFSAGPLGLPLPGSHPPAAGRLARLRATADQSCQDDTARQAMFAIADELARLIDEIRVQLDIPSAAEDRM
jgi:hypothetical protein